MGDARRDMHFEVIMGNALEAAKLVNGLLSIRPELRPLAKNDAMHRLLIIAEECRQALRPATTPADGGPR
jgi:hypothetical protein